MTDFGMDEHDEDMREVKLPSGGSFTVHKGEESFFNERVTRYMSDNYFSNISDLSDLDRVLIGEVLIWRWGQWIMTQKNYWGDAVDDLALQKQIKEISQELRQVKAALGMDKVSRDKAKGVDSVAEYLANLRQRALMFKRKRNEEFDEGMNMIHEVMAKLTLSDNCNADEQRELKCTRDDIWKWMVEEAFPKFREIDRKFRQEGDDPQGGWIQDC